MAWDDERPMSPHLQVYKLPMSALLSILHRGTGVILFLGLIAMVWVLHSVASGEQAWQALTPFWHGFWGKSLLLGVSFSLIYHLGHGIRHLMWDMGQGMEAKQTLYSGKLLIIGVTLSTLLVWSIILGLIG